MRRALVWMAVVQAFALQPVLAFGGFPVDNPPKWIAWWDFDTPVGRKVVDRVSSIADSVEGNFKWVEGAEGKAVRFDGFTTAIRRRAALSPDMSRSFSFEAWVAPATYPWNWCPLVARGGMDSSGFYFGIGPQGQVGLSVAVDGVMQRCETKASIPLRQWSWVAGTFDEKEGIRIYIDGVLLGQLPVNGTFTPSPDADMLIGMNGKPTIPSNPVRTYATLPAWFSFDGIIDEIRISEGVITPDAMDRTYRAHKIPSPPDIPQRVMPGGPAGPGRFGAYYTKLKYYEEWDNLFRVGDYSDIVVRFDSLPVRVVFWRGTRYSPAWVMENGQWMADQSAEYFDTLNGCFEHMIDPHCLYSHVRIIENTEARAVVHWRYVPVSVRKQLSQVDEKTGWSDCVDEYYTFYPDGTGIRKVVQYTSGEPLGPSEAIVLCQPGTTPEDNVNLDAMTLVNLKGESHVYSWADGAPKFKKGEDPPDPVVQIVNLKSSFKPFMIFEPGNNMAVYGIEQRPDASHFPWWNHWPVAQLPSDGRYSQAPDRASHFSLAWGGPPFHDEEGRVIRARESGSEGNLEVEGARTGPFRTYWSAWMYGASRQTPRELAALARSWARPPGVRVSGDDFISKGYDLTQRAYVLERRDGRDPVGEIGMKIDACADSPLVNACFLIRGWDSDAISVRLNGQELVRGSGYRAGVVSDLTGESLILWIPIRSERPAELQVRKTGVRQDSLR